MLTPPHRDTLLHKGALGLPLPRVPGHEIVGDIVAVHQSETTFQVGQRVGAPLVGGYCGECNSCKLGVFTGCVEANNWFTGDVQGTLFWIPSLMLR